MTKPVGILWDSVSNNTGDIAIGMLLKRFCTNHDIRFRVVDPFNLNPSDYSTFIIGGGQVLRTASDIFYQSFRIPGPHILNAVGIHEPDQLEYLRDYRLVSVRSNAERDTLCSNVPGLRVEVSPCNTILLDEYFQTEINRSRSKRQENMDAIGIHLNNKTITKSPGLIKALRELSCKYRIVFVPFTHYENDSFLMEKLSSWLPGSSVSTARQVISAYAEIGGFRAMISSSMHAAMFAYAQQVPVLAFPQDNKIRYFFGERGFPESFYWDGDSLLEGLDRLLQNPPDYLPSIRNDKENAHAHLDEVEKLAKQPVEYDTSIFSISMDKPFCDLRRRFYLSVMQNHHELNARETRLLDLNLRIGELSMRQFFLERLVYILNLSHPSSLKWLRKLRAKLRGVDLKTDRKAIAEIRSSNFFDEKWYLDRYVDVADQGLDAASHYYLYGGFQGKDPGPNFSSAWYLLTYSDVRNSGQNPLIHYLNFGQKEGRLAKAQN